MMTGRDFIMTRRDFHYDRSRISRWQIEIFMKTGEHVIMNCRDFHDDV